jgi:hypothetical protein
MCESGDQKQLEVFNYLSVVTSIILGLGLGHLLIGCARLIHVRESLSAFWLYVGWVVLLLPVYVTYWWAFWDYRKQVIWTFWGFFFLLIGPIGLYLITSLLLPDTSNQASFNAIAHYLNVRSWFFGLWAVLQVWGIMLSPWLKDGFKRASFFNHYKYAQYILLVALITGFLSATPSRPAFLLDSGVLVTFWIVLIYLLGAHRWILQTK